MSDDSFGQFVETALPGLLRFAHMLTGQPALAEDIVQTSLVKAMKAWPRIEGEEFWRQQAYVRRIVVNTHLSWWRRWTSRVRLGEVPDQPSVAADDRLAERDEVHQALSTLPPRQRAVLILRYYDDLSEAEIAATLGCQPGTVKSSAARGLAALRAQLAPTGTGSIPRTGEVTV